MDRIADAFSRAKAEERTLFVSYLCAGDPDPDTSFEACRTLIENGVGLIELGIPFSDPLADGKTNQHAAERALAAGMDHAKCLELVRRIREISQVPIIFYTYYNLVYAHGEADYVAMAKAAGVDGMLVLDLPPEEATTWMKTCREAGMKTVFIIAPTTPPERVETIANAATGFLYYVSQLGVTGVRATLAGDMREKVEEIRRHTDLPVVVGFGISKPEHVRAVGAVADGAVVGSALVNCLAANTDNPAAALKALAETARELVTGC
ncbi:tryptophan synthase subunit alpha [Ruficoccus amylovorans]|uniref:Tryptophan synthase alpha chain n=1 Tax=Ruficoccus amylovorans TaxID=1804625 RepID=A0A842HGR9_9BACT|nr:tryptophan synthase subunit alpha [Ruficoccus amylovorans]MBC2594441.1 tryptophan synthase subunit alpha [Ruficoccus amylovorans]